MRSNLIMIAAVMLAAPPLRTEPVDFFRSVRPILSDRCYVCHGPGQQMAGLRLDRQDSARRVLISRDGRENELLRRITSKDAAIRMPPWPPALSLQPAEIAALKSWIAQGSPWPESIEAGPALKRLLTAIARHDRAAMHKELRDGSLVNQRDDNGSTPLMHAALDGDLEAIRLLLDCGADPNLQDWAGLTALMRAVENPAKIRLLLARGAKVDFKSREGTTALIAAAMFRGSREVLTALLDHGADPNATNSDGASPLVQAATAGNLDGMKLLIERGARVNPGTAGTDPSVPGLSPLTAAAYYSGLDAVRLLLDNGAHVDEYDGVGSTALIMAVIWEDRPLVSTLLKRGADVNRPASPSAPFASDPGTPLMLAAGAESCNPEITRLLIKAGATADAVSRDGETAMTRALSQGHSAIVDTLISTGVPTPPANIPPAVARKPNRVPDIRTAVEKSLALLQTTDQEFLRKSGCNSCHNQGLPAMAMNLARQLGFHHDERVALAQNAAVLASMAAQREKAVQMMDPDGGSPLSGSYALISLDAFPDDTTAAFVRNLAARQLPDGRWHPAGFRPPMEYSDVSATALAIRALQLYAPPARKAQYNRQITQGAAWLARIEPRFTEERVYQLLGLIWTQTESGLRRKRAAELLAEQRDDGGWGQLASLQSDAYATGQALYALHQSGSVTASDAAYQRGVRFLVQSQADDGSWFVKSRAVKFQVHFEAGFPYGKDQFISAAGTSWAAMALMLGAGR